MKRSILSASLAAAIWLASAPAVHAEATTTDPAPVAAPAPDVQDVVFLGDEKPVLIRLHVQVEGGKSFTTAWDDYLRAMIKYMDRDNDGMLSESEAKFLPSVQMVQQAQQNGFFLGRTTSPGSPTSRKTRRRLKIFRGPVGLLSKGDWTLARQRQPAERRPPTNGLTDALFKRAGYGRTASCPGPRCWPPRNR